MKHPGRVRGLGVILVACGALLSCGGPADQGGIPSGPHPIIVLAVDGLPADALGCYGAEGAPTPAFDALATESVRFEWAFAQAADPAVSFASMLTGLYPTTSGVRQAGDVLPDEAETLAEVVSRSGMHTTAFLEGPSGGDAYGLGQGFVDFHIEPAPGTEAGDWLAAHAGEEFLFVLRAWSVGQPFGPGLTVEGLGPPEGFADRVQRVLASRMTDSPQSLESEDLEYAGALHAARVRVVDERLGAFLAGFREAGLDRRATLVVLGTRGVDLQQHGALGNESLHATVTRVPLMIRFPGGTPASTVSRIVEVIDLMPTLLDIAGLETPGSVQGSSLLPLIRGEGTPPYLAFGETVLAGGQRAIALGGYRMIHQLADDTVALYDLAADPGELVDLSAGEGDRIDVLRRHLEAWGKMVAAVSLDPELRTDEPLDDETLERLKSLGYIH
jgi:arylsulfatase A-like enzyme